MRRLALLVVVLAGCGGERESTPAPAPADPVAARDVLERAPYLGVSCRRPNSVACDRVGLAVWLRHPARGVEAEIDGRRFALDDEKWSSGARMFAGFLERAGLRGDGALGVGGAATWHGDPPVRARVRLWIRHEGGRPLTTTVRVPLHPGWG